MILNVIGSSPIRHPINICPRFDKSISKVTYSNGKYSQVEYVFIFRKVNLDGDRDRLLICFVQLNLNLVRFQCFPQLVLISK